MRGVSGEGASAHDGVVLTGELGHGLVSHDAAGPDDPSAPRPALAAMFLDRGPRCVQLSGWVSFADVERVAS
jgi:hypothetical protein